MSENIYVVTYKRKLGKPFKGSSSFSIGVKEYPKIKQFKTKRGVYNLEESSVYKVYDNIENYISKLEMFE